MILTFSKKKASIFVKYFGHFNVLDFLGPFKQKEMVKNAQEKAKKVKKIVKRPARTLVNLRKANRKLDPRINERIRVKKPPIRSKRSLKVRQSTKKWRERLDDDGQHRRSAIETASSHYRRCIKPPLRAGGVKKKTKVVAALQNGSKRRRRTPTPQALRPTNYVDMLNLIPLQYRQKPVAFAERVIYLMHKPKAANEWERGTVVQISRHIDSNWVLVRKNPAPEDVSANPYRAIDSTNVFVAPPDDVDCGVFANSGVYVLYSDSANSFYVGESHNITARIASHNAGTGSQGTRGFLSSHRLQPRSLRGGTNKQWERREVLLLKRLFPNSTIVGAGCSHTR